MGWLFMSKFNDFKHKVIFNNIKQQHNDLEELAYFEFADGSIDLYIKVNIMNYSHFLFIYCNDIEINLLSDVEKGLNSLKTLSLQASRGYNLFNFIDQQLTFKNYFDRRKRGHIPVYPKEKISNMVLRDYETFDNFMENLHHLDINSMFHYVIEQEGMKI